MPKDFITPQQARHIMERHEKERNDIRKLANREARALTGTEKKRMKDINAIIEDCKAVIAGKGRKGKR